MAETEKIQKVIARSGLCSRRKAEGRIALGKVRVNGKTAIIGQRVRDIDEVTVEGKLLVNEKFEYYILNKPVDVMCTRADKHAGKIVVELIPTKARIFPVGRLDQKTTGLIILTNDGELAQKIIHPSSGLGKKYLAQVAGMNDKKVNALRKTKMVDGKKIMAPGVKSLAGNSLEVTVHEGINRQVRKMCEQAGMRVISLHRQSIGKLELKGLKQGEWKKTTKEALMREIGL
ncbi:RNA pseudouridylate synthase [Candidatus Gugararchaeum adminiculabundum]|nr:RNA pseudouridylate synthase [Candidatus Gugararchaeum adminiculabundum]